MRRLRCYANVEGGEAAAGKGRLRRVLMALLPGSQWYALRRNTRTITNRRHATVILSWVPHHRQFAALCALPTLPPPLLQLLLHPAHTPRPPPPPLASLVPDALAAALERRFNASQQQALAAVAAAVKADTAPDRVVLVQGPPGTGKTAAICGMLATLLVANAPTTAVDMPSVGRRRGTEDERVRQLVRGC